MNQCSLAPPAQIAGGETDKRANRAHDAGALHHGDLANRNDGLKEQLGVVRGLRRRLDCDRLERSPIRLGAAVRRTLGDDDEIYENS